MVELRLSRDLVADPAGHPALGRPEAVADWLSRNRDMAALDGTRAFRLFMTIVQFPAMRAAYLRRIAGGSLAEVDRRMNDFVSAGLAAVFDGRYYLDRLAMLRAANLSRVSPAIVRRRHGACLERNHRERELRHDDGVNQLVVRFAAEGVAVTAGWRGEVNVPNVTQMRPDLLVPVAEGPHGAGFDFLEYERQGAWRAEAKLRLYRRMAQSGRTLPVLAVCDTERA